MSDRVISCNNLQKTYSSMFGSPVHALRGVNLDVPGGHIYGLLGPNGAGKTTFIKSLLGLITISGGSAELLGTPVPNQDVLSRIGYLPEGHSLPEHLTGEQVIEYYGKLNAVPAAQRRSRGDKYLDRLNMMDWKQKKVRSYSNGMRQRMALIQALLNEPDLLFLDEPTDGVDPMGRKEIRNLIEELRDNQNKTIFINSHILTELELICDRVAILKEGKVAREGDIDELTEGSLIYTITYEGTASEDVLNELRSFCSSVEAEDHELTVELETEDDLSKVQNALGNHNLVIKGMEQQETSLEDLFIDVVAEDV